LGNCLKEKLALVSKDTFIPKESDGKPTDDFTSDQLDNLLENFRKESHK
jgi:hypothetical protein